MAHKFRETFIYTYWVIIKNIIEDTDEEPGEKVHRVRSGRVPIAEASVPMDLGCTMLLARECIHKTESSWNFVI